ncbi:hypothetical protein O7632_06820 [Solwaraspora sp. WMMD406]|uniref:hypothetical protein n=1 Tax=Solwaraspora sp. WMMD406 TaxID=3016095 RepID=UPI0024160AAE|nr:hypothetical protein [Solwaraspora sp. WMMD406]MDG4763822.1 hypothetical protein [Solwaraspora sp. WMMD406]
MILPPPSGRPQATSTAPQALVGVPAAVGRLFRLEIDSTIRATAAAFAQPTMRSLDAIHLATAQVLMNESGAELVAFVTYDRRLLDCAKGSGTTGGESRPEPTASSARWPLPAGTGRPYLDVLPEAILDPCRLNGQPCGVSRRRTEVDHHGAGVGGMT